MRSVAVISALLGAAHAASAAPHHPRAKADFDAGVKAYQKGDYPAASEWFKRSYAVEPDAETLFAWAQAERQQDHCERAIALYRKLDAFALPGKNREVVIAKRQECQAILDAKQPAPEPEPEPEPRRPPIAREREPAPDAPAPRARHPRGPRAWYLDPVGDVLVLGGLVSVGVGAHLWVAAYNDANRASTFATYPTFQATARHEGTIGTGCLVGGAILLTGGIFRYALARDPDAPIVSGWLAPTSGGLALTGAF